MTEEQKLIALGIIQDGMQFTAILRKENLISDEIQADVFSAFCHGASKYAGLDAFEFGQFVDSLDNQITTGVIN